MGIISQLKQGSGSESDAPPCYASSCGRVTLYLGDCWDVMPTLEKVDAIITDPPYGIGKDAATRRPSNYQRQAGMLARDWDNEPAEVSGLLGLAPLVAIWGGNYYPLPPSRGWLAWHKPDAVPSMANVELAWTNQDRNARQLSWTIAATNAERVGHPTQKPVRVMSWTMEQVSVPENGIVLDPFMGSGTTGIACIRTGRRFVGIERDPKHYATALDRIQREIAGDLFHRHNVKSGGTAPLEGGRP